MWTPAIEERVSVPADAIPFGLIFASFMVRAHPRGSRSQHVATTRCGAPAQAMPRCVGAVGLGSER